nr:hypothetical protein [bacterium]
KPKTVMIVALLAVASAAGAETSSTATGVSRLMNPAISLNALFLGETSPDVGEANRIAIQEAEMQLTSVVDPFWIADMVVAWHEEHAHEGEEAHGAPHFATDIEVAKIRSTSMPAGLGLTLGKFYLPFGKHAALHTHQFPFVRAPIAVQAFLGDHGLTDVGAALDATVPLPWWSEITVYGVDGRVEIFAGEHRDLAFGGRWSNVWDVSDDATLELGGSYLTGPAEGYERLAHKGVDLTFKWVDGDRSQGPAATVTLEVILPEPEDHIHDPYGYYGHATARMHRNWWMGVGAGAARVVTRREGLDYTFVGTTDYKEIKANVVFAPSEFSALRAEVSDLEGDLRVSLQWNFTIGSHPAHLY